MGVGANEIGRSGASVATTKDIYAAFWNPAGLSEISGGEVSFSSQLGGNLTPVNFFGMAYSFPLTAIGMKVAVAFVYLPRLYVEASGHYSGDDFESLYLRFTLPGLSEDFDGKINSKTDEYKFAIALSPLHNRYWSIGASVGYVNCATTFAGVTMEDPENFQNISTVATTYSYGLGVKLYPSEMLTFGLNVKNIDNELAVEVDQLDDNGYAHKSYVVDFPMDVTVGGDWKYSKAVDLAMDFQRVFGKYGGYKVDIQVIRVGSTLSYEHLKYHLGFIVPLKLESSNIDKIEPMFPVSPTLGFGWHNHIIDLSAAFYIHPIMSIYKNAPSPSLDISLSYKF